MSPQQQQQQGSGGGDLENAALYVAATLFLMMILWMLFHKQFSRVILGMDAFFIFLPARLTSAAAKVEALIPRMLSRVGEVTLGDLLAVTNRTLVYYAPLGLYFPLKGAWTAMSADHLPKMTMSHDAETLLARLNQIYPYTAPVLGRDLNFDSSPEWASANLPSEFAKKHGIVKAKGKFDEQRCRETLQAQLGQKFAPLALAPHEKALYTVFAARLNRDMKGAQQLLDDLSRSVLASENGQPNYALADDLFRKHWKAGAAFVRVHAYTRTMLCSMFEASKLRGKVTSSMFLWLKPVDRTLWYALNRVGAPVPYPEAAGIWNHWKAEQVAFTGKLEIDWQEFLEVDDETGKPRWHKMSPMFRLKEIWVENAIEGLRDDLGNTGVIMVPDNQRSSAPGRQAEQGGMRFENLGAGSSAMRPTKMPHQRGAARKKIRERTGDDQN